MAFGYRDLDVIFQAYLATALWADAPAAQPEGESPPDRDYGIGDIAVESAIELFKDVEDFARANYDDLEELDLESIGHDFWLSRNGHGTGFHDRGYGDLGDRLHAAAKVYGEVGLYVGDDDRIWV